jgi:hypothetical protein
MFSVSTLYTPLDLALASEVYPLYDGKKYKAITKKRRKVLN